MELTESVLMMPAAHIVVADACAGVFTYICVGAEGPRFSLAEVQALLDRAEHKLRLCKPWMPNSGYQTYQRSFDVNRAFLRNAAAAYPGQATLPAQVTRVKTYRTSASACSGCSKSSFQLRKCGGCRQAAYCSRGCQVRHWKEGGHKQECAQLAPAAGAAAAGGSTAAT